MVTIPKVEVRVARKAAPHRPTIEQTRELRNRMENVKMSTRTRANWLIDAAVVLSGLVAILSGVYFLYFPSGGFEGGRNPLYGTIILFDRRTWDDIHAWGGVAMIIAIVVHLAIHWEWVVRMTRRVLKALVDKSCGLSRGAWVNVWVDATIAVSFLVTAVSGVYFLFIPAGGYQGGRNTNWDPNLLFSRTTWDLIHTWAGVIMIIAAIVHLWIHWRWVVNVSRRFFLSLRQQPTLRPAATTELTLKSNQ